MRDAHISVRVAGSGTSLKEAMLLGRKYMGSEISEEYCNIIKERLSEYEGI